MKQKYNLSNIYFLLASSAKKVALRHRLPPPTESKQAVALLSGTNGASAANHNPRLGPSRIMRDSGLGKMATYVVYRGVSFDGSRYPSEIKVVPTHMFPTLSDRYVTFPALQKYFSAI